MAMGRPPVTGRSMAIGSGQPLTQPADFAATCVRPAGHGERGLPRLSWVGRLSLCAGGTGLHVWPVKVGAIRAVTSTGGDNPQPYVRIRCPYCRRKYRVPPHRVGSGVRCAECGMPFQLGVAPGVVEKPTLRPGYVLPPPSATNRGEPAAKPPSPASPAAGEVPPGSAWHGVPSSLPVEPASPAGDSLGSPPRPSPTQGTAEAGDDAATSPDAAQAPVVGQDSESGTPGTLSGRSPEQGQHPLGRSQSQPGGEGTSAPRAHEMASADPSARAGSDVASEPAESHEAAAAPEMLGPPVRSEASESRIGMDSTAPVEPAGPNPPAEPVERAGEGEAAAPPPRPPKVRPQIIHIPKAHRPEMARPSPDSDGAGPHATAKAGARQSDGEPQTGRANQPTNVSPIDAVIAAHSRPMPRIELEELERELEMMRSRQGSPSPDEQPEGSSEPLPYEAEPVPELPSDQVLDPGSGMAGQDEVPEPLRSKLAANPPVPDPTPPETPDSSDITFWRRALEQAHASDVKDESRGEDGEPDSPGAGEAGHSDRAGGVGTSHHATGSGSGEAAYSEAHRPSSAPQAGSSSNSSNSSG